MGCPDDRRRRGFRGDAGMTEAEFCEQALDVIDAMHNALDHLGEAIKSHAFVAQCLEMSERHEPSTPTIRKPREASLHLVGPEAS
jgi:hypothetical protein